MRTIRSFVELINQSHETFSEKAQNYFHHIQNAADRMQMLIDTVFFYTRLDDPAQMAKEACDMAAVLEEVQGNLPSLSVSAARLVTAGLPEVYANRMQMMQLLQNLVANAIHHCEKPVTRAISADEGGDHWLFSVSDNGPGIEPVQLQKIFEPFKRLSSARAGSGIRLAICKKMSNRMAEKSGASRKKARSSWKVGRPVEMPRP